MTSSTTSWWDSISSGLKTLNPFGTPPTYAQLAEDAKNLSNGMSAFTIFQADLSNTSRVISTNTCVSSLTDLSGNFKTLNTDATTFITTPSNYTSAKIVSGLATLQARLTVIQNTIKTSCPGVSFTAAAASVKKGSTDTCAGADLSGNQVTRELVESGTFSLKNMFSVSRETIQILLFYIIFIGFAIWGGSTASNAAINKSPIMRFYYFIYGTLLFPFSLGLAYMRYSSNTKQSDNKELLQPLCEPFKYYAILAPLINSKDTKNMSIIFGFFFTIFYPVLYPFIYTLLDDDECYITPLEVQARNTDISAQKSLSYVKEKQAADARAAAARASAAAASTSTPAARPAAPPAASTSTTAAPPAASTSTPAAPPAASTSTTGGYYQSIITKNAMMA
jgi:hypothetical protein